MSKHIVHEVTEAQRGYLVAARALWHNKPHWQAAIEKALPLVLAESFSWNERGELVIASQSEQGKQYYVSKGVCQCQAFTKSRGTAPCYHRAMFGLVTLAATGYGGDSVFNGADASAAELASFFFGCPRLVISDQPAEPQPEPQPVEPISLAPYRKEIRKTGRAQYTGTVYDRFNQVASQVWTRTQQDAIRACDAYVYEVLAR